MFNKVVSYFDGISCAQIALNKIGIKYGSYIASEIDESAMKITKHNYPSTIHIGDVNNVDVSSLGDVDIFFGGSPCQDLSIASKEKLGLEGERSKLFYKYIDALYKLKPKYYLYENVGTMTNKNKDIISEYFGHQPIEINSNLLSCQNRSRYYWTNITVAKLPEDKKIYIKDILEESVDKRYYPNTEYVYLKKMTKPKNTGSGMIFECGLVNKEKYEENGCKHDGKFSQGVRVYSKEGKSCSMSANGGGMGAKMGIYYIGDGEPYSKENIRMLTPLEAERCQTIPDNYTSIVNNEQRYKCIGNAWTVDVIAYILSFIPEK